MTISLAVIAHPNQNTPQNRKGICRKYFAMDFLSKLSTVMLPPLRLPSRCAIIKSKKHSKASVLGSLWNCTLYMSLEGRSMTAQQKAIFTIVYFLVMLIPSYFSRRKIWEAVCKACGTTPTPSRQQVHKQEKAAALKNRIF